LSKDCPGSKPPRLRNKEAIGVGVRVYFLEWEANLCTSPNLAKGPSDVLSFVLLDPSVLQYRP